MTNLPDHPFPSDDDTQRPVNVFTLAGGFVVGLLAGGCLLFGSFQSEKPTTIKASEESNSTVTPSFARQASTDVPAARRPADRDAATLESERQRLQGELESLKLQQEINSLRQQLDQMNPKTTVATRSSGTTDSGTASLEYWNQINDIIEREARMRAAPLGGISATNAGSFFQARIQAADFATESLQGLETDGVDKRAVAVARSVAQWYEQGGEVAEMGRDLLSQGSVKQRQGTAGQRYQAAEREHAGSVAVVNAEGERVRQELVKKYGIDFPPLK